MARLIFLFLCLVLPTLPSHIADHVSSDSKSEERSWKGSKLVLSDGHAVIRPPPWAWQVLLSIFTALQRFPPGTFVISHSTGIAFFCKIFFSASPSDPDFLNRSTTDIPYL